MSNETDIQGMTFIHQLVFEIQDWTMKYRSHWHIYILRSIFVSHETTIQGTTFLYQIVFEI